MSLTTPDRPNMGASPTPARGYRRARLIPGRHLSWAFPLVALAGHLQVQVTTGGDTEAKRLQAKAAGSRWAHGQWRHLLNVAVGYDHPTGHARGLARLDALIVTDTAPFSVWSTDDMVDVPMATPVQTAVPERTLDVLPDAAELGSRLPIRLVTGLDDLLGLLGQGPLIVLDIPPRSSWSEHRKARTGWRSAVRELETGTRYQLRAKVVQDAQADGRLRVDPVWRTRTAGERWCPLYPMTSRWLEAETTNRLILGQRLTLNLA